MGYLLYFLVISIVSTIILFITWFYELKKETEEKMEEIRARHFIERIELELWEREYELLRTRSKNL